MAYPSDLVRTKNWGSEVLTDTDLEGQLDLIINWVMAFASELTGHSHDATTNEGPQIILSGAGQGVTGTLGETNGGTGQSSLTTGDILYCSASNTISKLAIGTTGQTLTVSAGGIPEWA